MNPSFLPPLLVLFSCVTRQFRTIRCGGGGYDDQEARGAAPQPARSAVRSTTVVEIFNFHHLPRPPSPSDQIQDNARLLMILYRKPKIIPFTVFTPRFMPSAVHSGAGRRVQHRNGRETKQEPSSPPGWLCLAVAMFLSFSGVKSTGHVCGCHFKYEPRKTIFGSELLVDKTWTMDKHGLCSLRK